MTGDLATIRRLDTDADLEALIDVVNAVTPDDPLSLDEIRWADATYPGSARFVAVDGGRVVGAATVGRIYIHPPEYPDLWASVVVEAGARRRGIGGRLLAAASSHARAAGKSALQLRAWDDRPEGIEFLVHRGFVELERAHLLRLPLAGLEAPPVVVPPGITLTTLVERPDLIDGVHAVALEAFDDIPGGDEPMAAGDLAEFRARDVDRPGIRHDAFMIAIDDASGEVAGYASLMLVPGSETVAWHDMTAVRRASRGQGIATVLKRATIAWAVVHGLTDLDTGNDEANASMRAVNQRLGYQPLPDEVMMRGPLQDDPARAPDTERRE